MQNLPKDECPRNATLPVYNRELLLHGSRRDEMLSLTEIEQYGLHSFGNADYVSIYGMPPREWYGCGLRLLGRTAVECTRDALGDCIGRDVASVARRMPLDHFTETALAIRISQSVWVAGFKRSSRKRSIASVRSHLSWWSIFAATFVPGDQTRWGYCLRESRGKAFSLLGLTWYRLHDEEKSQHYTELAVDECERISDEEGLRI